MSVFVNLEQQSSSETKLNINLESRTKGGDFLINPSQYSVGVNRFKVPLSSIPLFRVYEDYYHMALFSSTPFTRNDGIQKKIIDATEFWATGVIDDYPSLVPGVASLQINTKSIPNWGIDPKNGLAYKDINSQDEFCDLLNTTLIRCLADNNGMDLTSEIDTVSLTNSAAYPIRTNRADGNNFRNGGVAVQDSNGKSLVISQTINRDANADDIVGNHKYISRIEFKLKQITANLTASGTEPNFSSLSLWLRRTPVDSAGSATSVESLDRLTNGDVDEWCLFSHMLDGFQKTIAPIAAASPLIISSFNGITTTSENVSADNFKAFKLPDEYIMNFDTFVLKDVIGKRADGYTYELFFVDANDYTKRIDDATDMAYWSFPAAGDFELKISTRSFGNIREIEPVSGQSIGNPSGADSAGKLDTNRKLAPYFSFDKSTNKIVYNVSNHFLLGERTHLLLSDRLANLFNFNKYVVDKITNIASFNRYFATTYEPIRHNGVILYPRNSYGSMGVNRNNKLGWWNMNAFEEDVESLFKRDWLNGIVITSPNISLIGEVVGDGSTTRKVLTDFQIDPSSSSRDYLIYFNSGGMRLYQLKSTQPLKNIDIVITWKDIYGVLRDLVINKGEECNVKLEFRPNNQIYSLAQNLSTFDI